ncbi:MAG TPA: hypothetical protein DIW07_01310 [Lachnospiraceae bacterium]|jgi:hypothetical protein|nr:hypothetical protein [Lachnospiraceae bacterium]
METALRAELIRSVPELENSVYPTNAPEESTKPYLVYARISTDLGKTMEGYNEGGSYDYMFSCIAKRYRDMKSLTDKVTDFLKSLPKHYIAEEEETAFVEDIVINNISFTWEPELKVNRGIIDFTIYV